MSYSRGYTLIEVIVALAVFALLSVMSTSAIYHTFNTRARLTEQADQLNQLQLAITRIRQDTTQWVERSVRGNEGRTFPVLIGESAYVEFTRAGLVNPEGEELRSTLMRVAYLCSQSTLIRRTFQTLDEPNRKNHADQILLDHLKQCSFSYLSPKREVLNTWEKYAIQQQNATQSFLPIALKLNLEQEHFGEIKLLFVIPEGLYGST